MILFGKKSFAGVEINSYEVRAVEIKGTDSSPILASAGSFPLPEGAVKEGRVLKAEVVADALTRLWSREGIKTKNVILGVSNQDVLLRFAYFPKVAPDKLDNLVRFQAQDFLPIPVNEVELDYMVLGEFNGENGPMLHVLLVAAKKVMLSDFLKAISYANLNIADIDASNLALMRLLPVCEYNRTAAIVNLNKEQVGIMILRNGIPGLARMAVVNSSNTGVPLSTAEIEAFNQSAAASDYADNPRISDMELGEVRSSINYYQSQMKNASVDKVFLCGCASVEKGVLDELQHKLGLKIELLDPLKNMRKAPAIKTFSGNESAAYAICISLAMRGLEGGKE